MEDNVQFDVTARRDATTEAERKEQIKWKRLPLRAQNWRTKKQQTDAHKWGTMTTD